MEKLSEKDRDYVETCAANTLAAVFPSMVILGDCPATVFYSKVVKVIINYFLQHPTKEELIGKLLEFGCSMDFVEQTIAKVDEIEEVSAEVSEMLPDCLSHDLSARALIGAIIATGKSNNDESDSDGE